jgi:hypothetical protein
MVGSPKRRVRWSRPVAIPDDIDDPTVSRLSGRVDLPHNVHWSPPFRTYDLDFLDDKLLVYARVMTEGNEDDVRRFIDPAEVVRLWDELVLSPHVEEAWEVWLTKNGYLKG